LTRGAWQGRYASRQRRAGAAFLPAASRKEAATMTKPAKSESELVAMAVAELKVHADCPEGMTISVIKSDNSWEFRAAADAATVARPGYPECVAMLVQIGDHLSKHYDLKG
jgi:hypothetical protein